MTERQTELRDRQIPVDADLHEAGRVAARDAAPAPVGQRKRRRRLRTVVLVLATSILTGSALSVVPRAERVVTRQVTPVGTSIGTVEMRMIETSRGLPLRTWSLRRGPAEDEIKTHAQVSLSVTAVVLNMAIIAVIGLVGLAGLGPRKGED